MGSARYKRPFDLLVLGSIYLLFFPIWILVWTIIPLLIYLQDRGPVFYRQVRLGMGGRPFVIFKFRTMVRDAESETGPVWASRNDSRVTRIGRFLRVTRLDEIPQAINIVRGEMSIVGPRPERPELMAKFQEDIPRFAERLVVRPGIAGLAHVRGNSWTAPRNRLRYDTLYIKRMGPALDLKLIVMSCLIVLRNGWQEIA